MPEATRDKFILFLERTYRGKMTESSREEEADYAETKLFQFLCDITQELVNDIYSLTDKKRLEEIHKKYSSGHDLHKSAEDKYGSLLFKTLKDYYNYLDSKHFKGSDNIEVKPKRKKKEIPIPDNSIPEEKDELREEGRVTQVCVTQYERKKEHRETALRKYGYVCQVCGLDFEKAYGEIGKEFIEVHHLDPVSNYDAAHEFDPLDKEKGLVPLCSNCHSMIHRGGDDVKHPLSLQQLKEIYIKYNPK